MVRMSVLFGAKTCREGPPRINRPSDAWSKEKPEPASEVSTRVEPSRASRSTHCRGPSHWKQDDPVTSTCDSSTQYHGEYDMSLQTSTSRSDPSCRSTMRVLLAAKFASIRGQAGCSPA